MNEPIEPRILEALRHLLTGRVNELLLELHHQIPLVENGHFDSFSAVSPVITIGNSKITEKERIIHQRTFKVKITLEVAESPDSELLCYFYINAFLRALIKNPTLYAVAQYASAVKTDVIPPKKPNCGESWQVKLSLKIHTRVYG
jgi:hypothetical protein